jgi:enamine deaminase RidA (YjgF/YER057c/UK114 family)
LYDVKLNINQETGEMKKELINPPGSEAIYETMQFSQAVRKGNMIWVSGQVGMDKDGQVPDGIYDQARLAFQNLERVLEAAGASFDDVVELVTYHTSMKDIRGFSKAKAGFVKTDYPAWTALGVTELVMPTLLCEIRATAVVEGE